MKRLDLLLAALAILAFAAHSAYGMYWFQSGAMATGEAAPNSGASVQIQTIYPQNISYGSYGFWTGETLSNGGFVQVGYFVPNSTGNYQNNCTESGCTGSVFLKGGYPTWFWEYFPSGYVGSSFYGNYGSNNSVGENGTFNTYSFRSSGDVWNFYLNDMKLGSINMGTSTSGLYYPSAISEYAGASNNNAFMKLVSFRNFTFYSSGRWQVVPIGIATIGYGKGSDSQIINTYGVQEFQNIVNYFQVGSGLPLSTNASVLWKQGFMLRVSSEYGNLSGSKEYLADTVATLSAPPYVNISRGSRAKFLGWFGSGANSYTGTQNFTAVGMFNNITETAKWGIQYYLNVSGGTGSGWYDSGTNASFSSAGASRSTGYGSRLLFKGWSTGSKSTSSTIYMNAPHSVSSDWTPQYLVNMTSEYGTVYGNGWHDANSIVHVYATPTYYPLNATARLRFSSWGGVYNQSSVNITLNGSVFMNAMYVKQYLINITAEDGYGNPISVNYYRSSQGIISPRTFLDVNSTVLITAAHYKGADVPIKYTQRIGNPESVQFKIPVYNVTINTFSYIFLPVGVSMNITFMNGTTIDASTSAGPLYFTDVPMGYVSGYVKYMGVGQKFSSTGGGDINILVLAPTIIMASMIIAIVLVGVVFARRRRRARAGA